MDALTLLFDLNQHLAKNGEGAEASMLVFEAFWLPWLNALSQQCFHVVKEVRQQALTFLQRALLLPTFPATEQTVISVFQKILFPLLDTLSGTITHGTSKPHKELYPLDDVKIRSTALLSKIFLHHLSLLAIQPSSSPSDSHSELSASTTPPPSSVAFQELWSRMLSTLRVFYVTPLLDSSLVVEREIFTNERAV